MTMCMPPSPSTRARVPTWRTCPPSLSLWVIRVPASVTPLCRSCRSLSRRNASAAALKVRKTRSTSGSLMPWRESRSAIDAVLGLSCGPKQP